MIFRSFVLLEAAVLLLGAGIGELGHGLPRFVIVGYLDDQQFVHYDSDSQRDLPRGPWIRKDGRKEGSSQFGYDGKDFLSLDKQTLTWTAADWRAQVTKQRWEADLVWTQGRKNFLEGDCIEWLQKYLNYGKEKGGEILEQETFRGGITPNSDRTYHTWLSIEIDPKEREHYKCHVEHDGLMNPQDFSWEKPGALAAAVLLVIGILFYTSK
ncbi:putative MHC class I antigen protein [Naja naja]|nr:putative MHC class I antigen protein [Naja naja]